VSRKGSTIKRQIIPDYKYNSVVVTRFVNKLMLSGKKGTAEKIFYSALAIAKDKLKRGEMEIIDQAIRNAAPDLEVKSRRVGGATYQVPIEVSPERKAIIAIKWLIELARARKGQPMDLKLSAEIMDAFNNTGSAIKKKDDTHKMAEANKAFAHYRF
jgi:small subunit ribosomal protein S7